MATIDEVVEKWDKDHPNNPTETIKGKDVKTGGKIDFWSMYGRPAEWAFIKLADGYPSEKWGDRICYAFDFKSDKPPEINFQRKVKFFDDTENLYKFLDKNFNGKEINGGKLTLTRGRINPNHLVLKIVFSIDSSAKDICDGMEELIELTQKPICKFLKGKKEPPAESEDEIFLGIMKKYGIEKNENKELYDKCKEIYIQTLEILDRLYIRRIEVKNFLKVSYYTKKSVAQKLLIASKDENKYGEFRLYYTYGMNDPHEGKTLLHFLEIENEDLELPEPLPFIACFSFEVDSLNQFRLYGKDNKEEATGVGIVFDLDFFDNGTNKEQEKYRLYRCVYMDTYEEKISLSFSKKEEDEEKEKEEKEEKKSEMEALFKDLKEKIQDLKKEIRDQKKETREELKINGINKIELAKDLLIKIRYLVKDYAFMEERECRIIDWKNKKDKSINIEEKEERLYIEIGGVKNYVDEIYFAPCAEGMEVFEIETGIKCIRSRRPYKNPRGNNLTKERL